eukprot:CAMPEP_0204906118 /NCGR_PEP_ID=MMETSP1397-20131031/5804_1 /ASSEMBLY_ACC=CAM_ASM_000891 /TAXON_ID=49980 /ORGANISM="Climacostomum Climacostomum virens, Strain Stock W-24" /LENGTH=60 /DNA_ID=CAMNT_0052075093 /DNA_START=2023 /DNA_END=2205 /DNA_ORIENTATION=+
MARGNQRDVDRERARKRAEKLAPGDKKGDFQQRRERDADVMRKKQAEAAAKRQEEAKGRT